MERIERLKPVEGGERGVKAEVEARQGRWERRGDRPSKQRLRDLGAGGASPRVDRRSALVEWRRAGALAKEYELADGSITRLLRIPRAGLVYASGRPCRGLAGGCREGDRGAYKR